MLQLGVIVAASDAGFDGVNIEVLRHGRRSLPAKVGEPALCQRLHPVPLACCWAIRVPLEDHDRHLVPRANGRPAEIACCQRALVRLRAESTFGRVVDCRGLDWHRVLFWVTRVVLAWARWFCASGYGLAATKLTRVYLFPPSGPPHTFAVCPHRTRTGCPSASNEQVQPPLTSDASPQAPQGN